MDNFLAAAALSASAYKSPTISVIDHGAIALLKDALPLSGTKMEPTIDQLKAFFDFCVRASNLFRDIALVRYDERTGRIVILIGETIQVEILNNGEKIIR